MLTEADRIVGGQIRYYGYHWKLAGTPPDWFRNPFNGSRYPDTDQHWTRLPDFHPSAGDIKNIWETSRFDWVVTLARAYAASGTEKYLVTLNEWLRDWADRNPLNTGPNWKCGQEASVRIFNLLNAAFILNQHGNPCDSLARLVYLSMERISRNIRYAVSQDNNHGTSEAAGLFIGGAWLMSLKSGKYPKAERYSRKGRFWLEDRVRKLIGEDGSFSQHSVTYHRVLTDTLCYVEFWRDQLSLKPFSQTFYEKARTAANWLSRFTDELSGNAPNLGANDGAFLLNMHSCSYRDFRSTVLLASVLFNQSVPFQDGDYDEALYWLGIDKGKFSQAALPSKNIVLKEGYTLLQNNGSWALIRWPFFRFRPSHNDALHFDLWHKGVNIICDSGTYSYNPDPAEAIPDLSSVKFHNTVCFDGRDQMVRLGRFLLGGWLKPETVSVLEELKEEVSWSGSYVDNYGNRHQRDVMALSDRWIVTDVLSGEFRTAVIGFNVKDSDCQLEGSRLNTCFGHILLPADAKATLKQICVSEHYMELSRISRMEIEVTGPGTYSTEFLLVS